MRDKKPESNMADYTYNDIKNAYQKIGISKNKIIYLEIDFASLGIYKNMDVIQWPAAHFRALKELVGNGGTIVVPTTSYSLCNTDIPFDIKKTPSEMGICSEYVRTQKGAIRSFHPFVSFTALGKDSHKICNNVSQHAYGPETPMKRMIEMDTLCVSIGFHPHYTCRPIHEVEMEMGVPYRYVREYMHPVVVGKKIVRKPFYLHVWYYECDLKRDNNVKLWKIFESGHKTREAALGRGKVYSYSMNNFYRCAVQQFKKDLYILLKKIPENKPYRRKM